jgi:transposase-like protein
MLRELVALFKDLKSTSPDNEEKNEAIETALQKAERTLRVAEAQVAQTLGHELCRCTFPPQIALSSGFVKGTQVQRWRCPSCKKGWPDEDFVANQRRGASRYTVKSSYF